MWAKLVGVNAGYGLQRYVEVVRRSAVQLVGGGRARAPRHEVSLAAGIAYVIDVISVLPWVGLGVRGSVLATPAWVGFVPLVEARGGFDYLFSRYFGMTVQVSYGFALANRNSYSDSLTATVGLRWTVDL